MRSSPPVLKTPSRFQLILLILLLPALALLFVGGPDSVALPSVRYLWNMGHIALFATLTLLLHSLKPIRDRRSALSLLLGVVLISLIIEALQALIGRDFSIIDMLRNLIGSAGVILILNPRIIPLPITALLAVVFAADLSGLTLTLWQDIRIQQRSPVIENFESPVVFSRWHGAIRQEKTRYREGNSSGEVTFYPATYSSFSLHYPLRDWRGYQVFHFSIYNPDTTEQVLTLRIHDESHALNPAPEYNDRYNRSLTVQPGWNDLDIPLTTIASAPEGRTLDLGKIAEVQWFFAGLEQTRTLYFDDIRLQ